jgi:hypothetical protein
LSQLQTYEWPHTNNFVNQDGTVRKPGDIITHKITGGLGLLLARTETTLTILWSNEPPEERRSAFHELLSSLKQLLDCDTHEPAPHS